MWCELTECRVGKRSHTAAAETVRDEVPHCKFVNLLDTNMNKSNASTSHHII